MQDDPVAYWNDTAGPQWVATSSQVGTLLAPVSESILRVGRLSAGEQVLDVGCGAGALTEAAGQQVQPGGQAIGIDVSQPLLEAAQRRASPFVTFRHQNAEAGPLPKADVILSRFGIMFFGDSRRAFHCLQEAMKKNARCVFSCWQSPDRNPWGTWSVDAIRGLVDLPSTAEAAASHDVPGPFRFADPQRLTGLMEDAGITDCVVEAHTAQFLIPGSMEEVLSLVQQVGPLARAMATLDQAGQRHALTLVRKRLAELHNGSGVELEGAWWIVSGKARS